MIRLIKIQIILFKVILQLIIIAIFGHRHISMNSKTNQINKNKKQQEQKQEKQKIKLNELSKIIFEFILAEEEVYDSQLVKLLVQKFGVCKGETLKRRKYDVINILEKADIIYIDRSDEANVKYLIKSPVPNSLKDVQNMKEKVDVKKQTLRKKQQELRMLKNTKMNYERLMKINKQRHTQAEDRIQLPIMIMTSNFNKLETIDLKGNEQISLLFPPKTKYINNFLGQQNIIKVSL